MRRHTQHERRQILINFANDPPHPQHKYKLRDALIDAIEEIDELQSRLDNPPCQLATSPSDSPKNSGKRSSQ